ncbi:unnamed protein product [Closterium sp. Yama58-4]|nr:unnamed protein product [Closterium sp. Yama58-4]
MASDGPVATSSSGVTPADVDKAADEILVYWFGDFMAPDYAGPAPEDDVIAAKQSLWFRKDADVDAFIRARFAPLIPLAASGQLAGWEDTPRGALALVVLLDQFTRNSFRGSPDSFAQYLPVHPPNSPPLPQPPDLPDQDLCVQLPAAVRVDLPDQDLCVQLLLESVAEARECSLLGHSVTCIFPFTLPPPPDLADQDLCVQLLSESVAEAPEGALKDSLSGWVGYAHKHRDVIVKFGRFPHRNEVLGRESTAEEVEHVATHAIIGVVLLLLVLVCCSLAIQVPGNAFTVDLNPSAVVQPLSDQFKTTADLQSEKAGSATEVTKMATFPDVVVVGGGLAGLSAAVEVVKRGGTVLVLEKSERLGGNSAKASSGMNAARSGPQLAVGIEDKLEDFAKDTEKSGKGLSDMALVDVIVKQSADAVAFLEGFQIDLSSIAQLGGHSHPRTHRSKPDGKPMNIGFRIMSVLVKYVEGLPADKAKVVKQARVTELLTDDTGAVTGVKYETPAADGSGGKEETEVKARAVILATGGYSADKAEGGLLDQHTPKLRNLATTNGPFATGDGVRLGLAAGAGLVHMDQVQLHPTGYVDPKDPRNPVKFLAPEALRGCGGILLNEKGDRFVNELTTRDAVVEAILKNCGPLPEVPGAPAGGADMPAVSYLILNQEAINKFDPLSCQFYIGKGLIRKFDSVEALSEGTKLPAANVKAALDSYGRHDAEKGDPFGKTVFPVLFNSSEPPLYVAIITPSLHYCMGGLKFDTSGRILKEDGTPIPGLFGAGEVTGGLHGANRLGGNSLLECVVYGRVAGINAFERIVLERRRTALPERRRTGGTPSDSLASAALLAMDDLLFPLAPLHSPHSSLLAPLHSPHNSHGTTTSTTTTGGLPSDSLADALLAMDDLLFPLAPPHSPHSSLLASPHSTLLASPHSSHNSHGTTATICSSSSMGGTPSVLPPLSDSLTPAALFAMDDLPSPLAPPQAPHSSPLAPPHSTLLAPPHSTLLAPPQSPHSTPLASREVQIQRMLSGLSHLARLLRLQEVQQPDLQQAEARQSQVQQPEAQQVEARQVEARQHVGGGNAVDSSGMRDHDFLAREPLTETVIPVSNEDRTAVCALPLQLTAAAAAAAAGRGKGRGRCAVKPGDPEAAADEGPG